MSADRVDAFLEKHRSIALDTCVIIYAVESHPKYFTLAKQILRWIRGLNGHAITSTITMTEALLGPYRRADLALVQEFHALLVMYPHLEWVPPTLHIAERAAQIRADHNLRTPDAIQAATALAAGVTGFVTNDPIFRRVPSLDVLILDEMLQ